MFDIDWGTQVEIQDSVLKAVSGTDLISYVHVTPTKNRVTAEITVHAEGPCEQFSRQEHLSEDEKVLEQTADSVAERPEDALEIEVRIMQFI